MKVTYTPDDGDPVVWDDFTPMKLMSVEAETIEKYTGCSFPKEFNLQSSLHRRALLWVLLKRRQQVPKFSEFDYRLDQLDFTPNADERAQAIENLQHITDPEERAAVLKSLDLTEEDLAALPKADRSGNGSGTPTSPSSPGSSVSTRGTSNGSPSPNGTGTEASPKTTGSRPRRPREPRRVDEAVT